MEDWQLREKHYNDVKDSFNAAGCKKLSSGMITVWKGKEMQEELEKRGHSHMVYNSCNCHK